MGNSFIPASSVIALIFTECATIMCNKSMLMCNKKCATSEHEGLLLSVRARCWIVLLHWTIQKISCVKSVKGRGQVQNKPRYSSWNLISTWNFCSWNFQHGRYVMQTSVQKSKDYLVSVLFYLSVRNVGLNSHFTSCTLEIEICALAFSCYL